MTFKKEFLKEDLLTVLTKEPQPTKALMKLTGWKRTTLMNTLQALYNEGVIERQVISGMPGNTGYVYLWSKTDGEKK